MQSLGVKKFFLDYLMGSGLIFLSFFLIFGNITAMDLRETVALSQECHLALPVEEVVQSMQGSLRTGEYCKIVSPCVDWHSIRCDSAVSVPGLFTTMLLRDTPNKRVMNSLRERYGFVSYRASPSFRFSLSLLFLLVFYGLVLAEAGAMMFALWRQNNLKQTFSLPVGSKTNQIIKPFLLASLLAIVIAVVNYSVYELFDHPEIQSRQIFNNLVNSVVGIVAIVFVAPLAEELVFRGVLLRFFIEKKRWLLGTVLVSLLFAAMHGFVEPTLGWQLYLSSIYILLSVILCQLYIRQKTIWAPIVFHGAFNATMVFIHILLV